MDEDGCVHEGGCDDAGPYGAAGRPVPVPALRGVRVVNVAAGGRRSYVVSDVGVLWAWGTEDEQGTPVRHGEMCPVPRPLVGVAVLQVAAGHSHTLALDEGGGLYAWGNTHSARYGALGLGRQAHALPLPTCVQRASGAVGYRSVVDEALANGP